MQIRVVIDLFSDSVEDVLNTTQPSIGQGRIVESLPTGLALSLQMRNIVKDVIRCIEQDSTKLNPKD